MQTYLEHLEYVYNNGIETTDRTGTGTLSVFGGQMRFDLSEGFPLVTTKRVFWRAVVGELLWFLEGSTNRHRLEGLTHGTRHKNTTIWDKWSSLSGDLGPIYGRQWRWFSGVDQIKNLIRDIEQTPDSRRLVVSAWNPPEIKEMALPPCHTLWQVRVLDGKLHLHLYQRSADLFLGVPFNIASYALLTHMLAHVTGYEPGELVMSFGDMHIYLNHLGQVMEQLVRKPRPLPTLWLDSGVRSIFDFSQESIKLIGYDPHPTITAPVAV